MIFIKKNKNKSVEKRNKINTQNIHVKKISKFIWGSLPLLIIFLLIIGLYSAIQSKKQTLETQKEASKSTKISLTNVIIMDVKENSISNSLNLPGIIEPWVKLDVLAEVNGQILLKAVKEGIRVKKGEILVKIDSTKYRNTYNSAKASFESANASKKRYEKLYKLKLSKKVDYENAVSQAENSKTAMNNADFDLEKCIIRAPISGIVNKVYIEEGMFLSSSTKVAEILQLDKVKVNVGIPESDVNAVRKIKDFEVSIDALGKKKYYGTKYYLSKTTDSAARIYDLVISISNPFGELLPDMFARVDIIKNKVDKTVTLPVFSIISSKNKNTIFIIKKSMFRETSFWEKTIYPVARSKEVELGIQEGSLVEITKGLNPGEKVVVVGQRNLDDGQYVKIIRTIKDIKELDR